MLTLPFCSEYWQIGTSTKSENPDEMPHNAAFHQGLHSLQNKIFLHGQKCIIIKNFYL